MKNNISSANLLAAMYFLGLSAQYSVENNQSQNSLSAEESRKDVSPEQFVGLLKTDAHLEKDE